VKIVVAPDKFKGSLAADQVAAAIAARLRAELPAELAAAQRGRGWRTSRPRRTSDSGFLRNYP